MKPVQQSGGRRFGVLGKTANRAGERMLILPDDSVVFVPADSTDDELVARFRIERVVRAPKIPFCAGVLVDGPMAGADVYAINEIGFRLDISPPRSERGRPYPYELVRLAGDGQPAQLQFLGHSDE